MREAKQLFALEEDSKVNHTIFPLLFLYSRLYLFGLSVDFLYVRSLLIFWGDCGLTVMVLYLFPFGFC